MLTQVIAIAIYGMICAGAGYYLGERGWVGVKNDLSDIKTDIQVLKAKVDAPKS